MDYNLKMEDDISEFFNFEAGSAVDSLLQVTSDEVQQSAGIYILLSFRGFF